MLTNHTHDPSGLHHTAGAESHDGSQHSYSTYAASHDAPVHGFHVQPAGALHPPHMNDCSLASDSPHWGRTDGMYDDGASSVADSQQTSLTTSSNTGVDVEQKRLIDSEREARARF